MHSEGLPRAGHRLRGSLSAITTPTSAHVSSLMRAGARTSQCTYCVSLPCLLCLPLLPVCPPCCHYAARALLRKRRAKQLADDQSRARWQAEAVRGGDGADAPVDWLEGASAETLVGPSAQERGYLTRVASARLKDPTGSFAYVPAVARDHPTVDPMYHNDMSCPGAGWFLAMMVT